MESAVKRYAASGAAALMGAGVVLAVPITQQAEFTLPALYAPAIELTAAPDWLEQLTALAQAGAAGAGDLVADELRAPFPIVRQVIVNQLTNALAVAIGAGEGGEAIIRGFEELPAAIAGLFNDPAGFLSAVIELVTEVITQFPQDVFGPVVDALAASVLSSIDNAVGVAGIVVGATPGLLEDLALVPLGPAEEAVRQAFIVAATALTTPLEVPRAIGEAVYAVGSEAVGQVSVVVDDVIDIRGEILDEITPGGGLTTLSDETSSADYEAPLTADEDAPTGEEDAVSDDSAISALSSEDDDDTTTPIWRRYIHAVIGNDLADTDGARNGADTDTAEDNGQAANVSAGTSTNDGVNDNDSNNNTSNNNDSNNTSGSDD